MTSVEPSVSYDQLVQPFSEPRLSHYLALANGDKALALRLYLWNGQICQTMYMATQTVEVVLRNALLAALTEEIGPAWYEDAGFLSQRPDSHKRNLANALNDIQNSSDKTVSPGRVVARLPFGFWTHLLAKGQRSKIFRKKRLAERIPLLLTAVIQQALADRRIASKTPVSSHRPTLFRPYGTRGHVDRKMLVDAGDWAEDLLLQKGLLVKSFRDRVAHHRPVHDHAPHAVHDACLEIAGWLSLSARMFIHENCNIRATLEGRPRS
ncbi:Abi family protein [Azospirillum sp. SYSU D00513]|uniref:Abi family protein n=1 Tax=Azospirillum sp. SYSU D00513 TaxID=2812561 RepID=UPI001A95CA47|nr:Abi family protein [Azospirillum sp. SYSU D00513]